MNNLKANIIVFTLRSIIPLTLLISGLYVFSKPGAWSLLVGVPLIVFGAMFLIYLYDEFSGAVVMDNTFFNKCIVCKRIKENYEETPKEKFVCNDCQKLKN